MMGCIALGGLALPVLAEGQVSVIGRAEPGLVKPMHQARPAYELIQISNMHRDSVGLKMQHDMPAPEVIQLQMGGQPIFVDPDRNYARTTGGIDDGHSILRAQRTYKALTAQDTAYVIRRDLKPAEVIKSIMPRAILLRPDYMQRRAPQEPVNPVPAPLTPKVEKGPVALVK